MKSDLALYYQGLTDREFQFTGRFLVLLWLIKALLFSPAMASDYPSSILIPTGIFTFFSQTWIELFFTFQVLTGYKIVLIVALSAFLIRITGRRTGLFSIIMLYIFNNVSHSYGSYMYHAEIVLFMCMLVYIISLLIRNSQSVNTDQNYILFFFCCSALALLLSYALIGTFRLVHGGTDLFLSDYMLLTVIERSVERIDYAFTTGLYLAGFTWFGPMLRAGFIITTILEILSPFVFFSRRFRVFWLAVIIPFHLLTLLLMNIFFWENILLILILLSPALMLPNNFARKQSLNIRQDKPYLQEVQDLERAETPSRP